MVNKIKNILLSAILLLCMTGCEDILQKALDKASIPTTLNSMYGMTYTQIENKLITDWTYEGMNGNGDRIWVRNGDMTIACTVMPTYITLHGEAVYDEFRESAFSLWYDAQYSVFPSPSYWEGYINEVPVHQDDVLSSVQNGLHEYIWISSTGIRNGIDGSATLEIFTDYDNRSRKRSVFSYEITYHLGNPL